MTVFINEGIESITCMIKTRIMFRLCMIVFLNINMNISTFLWILAVICSWQIMNHLLAAIVRHLESSSDIVFSFKQSSQGISVLRSGIKAKACFSLKDVVNNQKHCGNAADLQMKTCLNPDFFILTQRTRLN